MQLVLPGSILLFVILLELYLKKQDHRWHRRMLAMERRNAEVVKRIRRGGPHDSITSLGGE